MGRKKLEIKRIEDKSSRQITFCKRRNGLMEKARQLSVLCESSVALIVISATGKLYSFSSGDSMAKILGQYEKQHADDDLKTLDHAEKAVRYLSHKELLERVQCKLEEVKSNSVSIDGLKSLEEQFKTALSVTRARKMELMMEFMKNHHEKVKLLKEENQVLASKLTEMKKIRFLETEDERAMSRENISGNNPPESLRRNSSKYNQIKMCLGCYYLNKKKKLIQGK